MTAPDAPATPLSRQRPHYGWVVVGVTFLVMLTTAGAVGASGVLMVPLEKEFGWTTAEISQAFALRLTLYGLMGPFAAALINRFGMRWVVTGAAMLTAIGVAGSFFMTTLGEMTLYLGLLVGLGTGMTAMVLAATVAGRWFVARRGLVMGILAASSASGQLLFLPILAGLTERFGWRLAFTLPVAGLILAALLVLVFMRDRPADVGLAPYGGDGAIIQPPPPERLGTMLLSPLRALREASSSPTFWMLAGTFFVCGASTNGLIQTHFVPMCGDHGMGPVPAAGMLAAMGIFDLVGTIGSGWLSDRLGSRRLLFAYYGLRGLSLIFLQLSNFMFFQLSIFTVFYGLDWIATVPPTVKLTTERFGERANLVFGWVFAAHQVGAATVAYAAGLTRTEFGTYLPIFIASGVLCLAAAIGVIGVKERFRSARPDEEPIAS